ncbi:MAG TPA: FAD-binding protein [Planctomycetes bacterium]|nr:FAD-binding protein [Planctomycetota bacterium]
MIGLSWAILAALLGGLAVAVTLTALRRSELARTRRLVEELGEARVRGTRRARLQYPQVDLSRCLGCGTCVSACPEEGVLQLIHGQAIVVHGARCVGHGLCAEECPTGAIVVALGDIEKRDDIPAVDERFEVTTVPGLFLAGEVTGFALIRTAITQGTQVGREVAARLTDVHPGTEGEGPVDLCVVGAGPAGLSCALEAQSHGLSTVVLEQESLGGTVASYPRRKLVMTRPVVLPVRRRLDRSEYRKEDLMRIWEEVVEESGLPVRTGVRFQEARRGSDGVFEVRTEQGIVRARHVCLALGRRGTPRKLGVPGEDLPKVAYSLLDAQSYVGCRILVVGGGDSAIEAALGLAEQEGNEVTLSYRRHAFFRIKARNEARIEEAMKRGRVRVVFESEVISIDRDAVELAVGGKGSGRTERLGNDYVFVLAGGIPPFKLLKDSGVSFSPEDRLPPPTMTEKNSGLLSSLTVALLLCVAAIPWILFHRAYYFLADAERPHSVWHDLLRPSGSLGITLGSIALGLLFLNLSYLLRRSPRVRFSLGPLRGWMTMHVASGLLALLFALLHGAMAPRHTVGGHALAGLAFLALTGAVGRYLYAFVPRAANGRELELDEVRARVAALSSEWEKGNRMFGERVRDALAELIPEDHWKGVLPRRVLRFLALQHRARRTLAELRRAGRAEGIPAAEVERTIQLARQAQRSAFAASHFEDLRGILASWRYFHRWAALLLVALVLVHVFVALRYGGVLG